MEIMLVKTMFRCLILTIIFEILVALIIFRIKDKKDLINIILVNVLTNPLVVSILLHLNLVYSVTVRDYAVLPIEIIVVFIEGFIYSKVLNYKKVNPYVLSLILNCSSFFLGEIFNFIIK